MTRTPGDLRHMASECRRLAVTCESHEAEQALGHSAREMDVEALRMEDKLEGSPADSPANEERELSENPDRGQADVCLAADVPLADSLPPPLYGRRRKLAAQDKADASA
jgi:hypothetical protein